MGRWTLRSVAFAAALALFGSARGADRPNIVVIVTDDQGYADISFNPNHPPEVATPHMDALAREGVFFPQAYISGSVCSPTRAGLMLGRYQQRVGVYTAGEGGRGFDPTIPIFPAFLPDDYASMAVGKWHLGLDEDYPELKWHPLRRGLRRVLHLHGPRRPRLFPALQLRRRPGRGRHRADLSGQRAGSTTRATSPPG